MAERRKRQQPKKTDTRKPARHMAGNRKKPLTKAEKEQQRNDECHGRQQKIGGAEGQKTAEGNAQPSQRSDMLLFMLPAADEDSQKKSGKNKGYASGVKGQIGAE